MNRISTRYTLILLASICSVPVFAQKAATPEAGTRIVEDALTALGGKQRVLQVDTMILEGSSHNSNIMSQHPGVDLAPDMQPEWKRTVDFKNIRASQQALNAPAYPTPVSSIRQGVYVDGDNAWSIGGGFFPTASPRPTRQPQSTAQTRRTDLLLCDPIGIVQAALAAGTKLSNARTLGGRRLLDIETARGEKVTLATDVKTNLPATVSYTGDQAFFGDVVYETAFSDYRVVDGVKIAMRRTSKMYRFPTTDITVTKALVNPKIESLAVPADLAPLRAPTQAAQPAQPRPVTVESLGPGLWMLGPSYYSVLIEFADHTELFEVPQNDAKALGYIAEARKLVPNKPLTKAIVSHHHADHAGGVRAAISEGLIIVTYEENKAYFEEIASRPHTIAPDTLARNPKPAKIETVGEELTEKDALQTMQLIHMDGDPHSATTLMAYFPTQKLIINADLWDGRFAIQPFAANTVRIMQERGIKAEREVDIHNGLKTQADFEKAFAPAAAVRP